MRTSKVLSVSLPAEMLSRIESMARSEDRTVSELVREAIRTYENLKAKTLTKRSSTPKLARRVIE